MNIYKFFIFEKNTHIKLIIMTMQFRLIVAITVIFIMLLAI
jgi:hypothetical protein